MTGPETDPELIEQERLRREEILRRLKEGKARVKELEAQLAEERNKWQIELSRLELKTQELRAVLEEARWHTPTRVREMIIAVLEEETK